MKKILLAVLSMGLLSTGLMANDIAGTWVTIDDETGLAKSHVNIWVHNGVAYGKVTKLLNRKPGEDPDPVCNECKGESHGKKVVGLTILWGLKADGDEWTGGHIMDPKNGKVYPARLRPVDGGRKLEMRGYFGPFYRTQVWLRVE